MNKILTKQFIIFLSALFILSAVFVFAAPPAPTPVCSITGVIKSVEFKDAYDKPCLKEPYGCPTDTELRHPARYFFDISINSVAYVSGDTSSNTCQNMYPVGSVQEIFINKDKVKSSDTFAVNQQIEGVVRSFWGKSFDSYTLKTEALKPVKLTITGIVISGGDTTPEGLFDVPRRFVYQVKQDDSSIIKVTYTAYPPSPAGDREMQKIRLSFHAGTVQIGDYLKARGSFDKTSQTLTVADEGDYIETSPKQEPIIDKQNQERDKEQPQANILDSSEVSEKLLQQNYVDNVGSTSLQSDQQTYSVRGTKKGKLLFFIPVTLNIQFEVDAITGAVKAIKKPWWSFLVR